MATAAKKSNKPSPSPSSQPVVQTSARHDLIKYIAKEAVLLNLGNQEKAAKALEIVLAGIVHVLKEEKQLRFLGFGTFSVQNIPARTGRNPRTGNPIEIAAQKRPVFKAGKDMKEALNPNKKETKKAVPKKK